MIFNMARQVVVDPGALPFATATAYVSLTKYHLLAESKVGRFSFAELLAGIVEVFARHVANEKFDIRGEEAVQGAEMTLISALDGTKTHDAV